MSAIDVLSRLTQQMKAVLDKQNELATNAFATDVGFEEMRRNYVTERAFWNEGGPSMAKSMDDVVPGPGADVPIRLHYPQTTITAAGVSEIAAVVPEPGPRPCLMYIHGGGFVVGNLETHDRVMRTLADLTGSVVAGIDYSLSPEAKFPQALHECAAVAGHLARHAAGLGLDGQNFSIAGDSGGASLALGTALYLRDNGGTAIRCLLLYYGMFGLTDSTSRRLYGGPWDGLTPQDLQYYLDCYLADPADIHSPYIDALAADLTTDMPACYIAGAELDPILDDSVALATILKENHVPVKMRIFNGVLHAFLHHSRMLPEAMEAMVDGAGFYHACLTTGAP